MPRKKKLPSKAIEQYEHKGEERLNNPLVGLVKPEYKDNWPTFADRTWGGESHSYYDLHDPPCVWVGKAGHASFEMPTISLHVHARIDTESLLEAARPGSGEISAGCCRC